MSSIYSHALVLVSFIEPAVRWRKIALGKLDTERQTFAFLELLSELKKEERDNPEWDKRHPVPSLQTLFPLVTGAPVSWRLLIGRDRSRDHNTGLWLADAGCLLSPSLGIWDTFVRVWILSVDISLSQALKCKIKVVPMVSITTQKVFGSVKPQENLLLWLVHFVLNSFPSCFAFIVILWQNTSSYYSLWCITCVSVIFLTDMRVT